MIKAKGVRGHVVKHHMSFEEHKICVFATGGLNDDGCEFDPYRENKTYGYSIIRSRPISFHTIGMMIIV
jgi:hypothetical protein